MVFGVNECLNHGIKMNFRSFFAISRRTSSKESFVICKEFENFIIVNADASTWSSQVVMLNSSKKIEVNGLGGNIDLQNTTMQKNTKRIKENAQQIYSHDRNEVLFATRQKMLKVFVERVTGI